MLYKRKIITSSKWFRLRIKLNKNCKLCITSPTNCSGMIAIIGTKDETFTTLGLNFCCRTLKRGYCYLEIRKTYDI